MQSTPLPLSPPPLSSSPQTELSPQPSPSSTPLLLHMGEDGFGESSSSRRSSVEGVVQFTPREEKRVTHSSGTEMEQQQQQQQHQQQQQQQQQQVEVEEEKEVEVVVLEEEQQLIDEWRRRRYKELTCCETLKLIYFEVVFIGILVAGGVVWIALCIDLIPISHLAPDLFNNHKNIAMSSFIIIDVFLIFFFVVLIYRKWMKHRTSVIMTGDVETINERSNKSIKVRGSKNIDLLCGVRGSRSSRSGRSGRSGRSSRGGRSGSRRNAGGMATPSSSSLLSSSSHFSIADLTLSTSSSTTITSSTTMSFSPCLVELSRSFYQANHVAIPFVKWKQGSKANLIMKITLMGESGTGKSSFRSSVSGYPFCSSYQRTFGVDFSVLSWEFQEDHQTKRFHITLWDTDGHYDSLGGGGGHFKLSVKNSHCIVLMYSIAIPSSLIALKPLYERIISVTAGKEYPYPPKFIVLANMIDKDKEWRPEKETEWIQNNLLKTIPVVPISCRSRSGIARASEAIVLTACGLLT